MKLIIFIAIVFSSVSVAQTNPLSIVTPYDFSGMNQKEKEFYVAGVLEGQAFLLYGNESKDFVPFSTCVKKEGVQTIAKVTETSAMLDGAKNPMAWYVATAIGIVCKKYR